MPRRARPNPDAAVWRVAGLRDLELQRAERSAAARSAHFHGQYEIAVIEQGAQRIRHRGVSHLAGPGSVVVVSPGEVHAHNAPTPGAICRSFFPDLAALADASSAAAAQGFRGVVLDDADLARRIIVLHRLLARPGSAMARETNAVTAATLLVERHGASARPVAEPRPERNAVARVRAYLHERLGDNVSLAELTALTGVPDYALVRAFSARVGMPPHAYHLQLRINRAKVLLGRGAPVARVAAETGFVDQSHFTRHFRRSAGVTPGAYAAAVVP